MKIQETDTLFEVTRRFPSTVDVFVRLGLQRMADEQVRREYGPAITVASAAQAQGVAVSEILRRLEEAAGTTGTDAEQPRISIMGLVPCPIRVPLTNSLDDFARTFTARSGLEVHYNLQAAYTGTEWMEESIPAAPGIDDLPDIFLSAGFRTFFTDRRFLQLRAAGAFADRSGWKGLNRFGVANDLQDPQGHFSVISVVPAVFMVNRHLLGDRPVPRSWEEVLSPQFENSLALPIGDFDLFDALLLGVYRRFGMDGVRQLGRNMFQSLHPAQMISGALGRAEQPLITIMPWFFTRTVTEASPLIPVWPADGALAAPVLLITRRDRPEIQPVIDFLTGVPVSRILSRLGLFPSTHPENDDFSADESPLQWPGWDFLLSPELPRLLQETTAAFNGAATPPPVRVPAPDGAPAGVAR